MEDNIQEEQTEQESQSELSVPKANTEPNVESTEAVTEVPTAESTEVQKTDKTTVEYAPNPERLVVPTDEGVDVSYGAHTSNSKPSYSNSRDRDRSGYGNSRDARDSRDRSDAISRRPKYRKFEKIVAKKADIDYKKPEILAGFLTEKGKILSRSLTGSSAQNQRKLTQEVKKARFIGFLPSS